ncbi:DUF1330 domain-containing protein [Litoribacillus peritrichatus]|uniref:DUF1330 domain-containing protein n=1 Tax=Litoribacillus peritrichatus TaxID=718191 RepID=A0ABP7MDQ2_9GAMM
MTALIVVDLTPKDKEKLSLYSSMAGATLVPFGGEFVGKGPIEALHGESAFQTKVVIQFPDKDSAVKWYNSDAYQEIIPIRDQGMDSQFHIIG